MGSALYAQWHSSALFLRLERVEVPFPVRVDRSLTPRVSRFYHALCYAAPHKTVDSEERTSRWKYCISSVPSRPDVPNRLCLGAASASA